MYFWYCGLRYYAINTIRIIGLVDSRIGFCAITSVGLVNMAFEIRIRIGRVHCP